MNDTLYRCLAEHAGESARVAKGITADQLTAPTPCTEFDTRALINHWVRYTSHGLEHRALRKELPAELVERDFTADPAWADAYAAQLERGVAAWAQPAAWEGDIDLGGMAMPAPAVLGLLLAELALHGWDVARATGQEYQCSEESAEVLLAVVRENAETYRQYQGFADAVVVADGAPAFERALALSGRAPGWRAAG
ncbi:TIGR03086 family metal-binding protein [Kitasatospora sp. RB6PN24]|uniref:TIGR03086 family metal-binding protein n=1 Tax=Kitasatospora humi TaxID=2893891 RepID=UPI001E6243A1|nr:TIGR03086 family metal-binding protein [Kitasatospora humi]MCC9308419.1 TIGR03086 family metal-binding protein [Kitasatospora humi]